MPLVRETAQTPLPEGPVKLTTRQARRANPHAVRPVVESAMIPGLFALAGGTYLSSAASDE